MYLESIIYQAHQKYSIITIFKITVLCFNIYFLNVFFPIMVNLIFNIITYKSYSNMQILGSMLKTVVVLNIFVVDMIHLFSGFLN